MRPGSLSLPLHPRLSPLTFKRGQTYVYASYCKTRWLGAQLAADPQIHRVPFMQLALAGAHDAVILGDNEQHLLTFIHEGDVHEYIGVIAKALPFVQSFLGRLRTLKIETARVRFFSSTARLCGW